MSDLPYTTDRMPSELSDDELAAFVLREVTQDDHAHGRWKQEAREAYDFVSGHQWSAEDKALLDEQKRPAVTFNRIAPMIDAVCGAQVNNRQEIKVLPRSGDDGGVAEVRNLVLAWIRDNTDAEDEESEAFRDAAIGGIGALYTFVSNESDAFGEIRIERCDPFEMGWDRNATRKNLEDSTRFWRRRWLDPDYVRARWPEFSTEGEGAPPTSVGQHSRAVGDQYQAGGDVADQRSTGIPVTHLQWCESVCIYYVKGPLSGQTFELTTEEWEALEEKGGEWIDAFENAKRLERRWYECVECGGKISDRGPTPDPRQPSYKFITGRYDRTLKRYYGLVRSVIDPQRWANKWLVQSMHILNTSAKSGVIVEEGAVDNIRQFEEDYAKPGSVSRVRAGGLSQIRDKVPPTFPAGFANLLQLAIAAIPDVTGINREMLGTVDREQPGILEAQRKQAAQAVLAPLFDALRRYYKAEGRLLMELARKYVDPQKMIRITSPEGKPRDVQMAVMQDVGEYDVIVDQAPLSPNQKVEVWQTLQPALAALVKMGMPLPVWSQLLTYSPLPESAVQKIIQGLENQPPLPDPAMVKMQADMQMKQQDQQMKAAEMQAQFAMDEKRAAMDMAMQKQQSDMQLQIEARKAELDLYITQQKAAVDLEIANRKAQQQREIADYTARVNADAQMAKVAGDRESASAAIANTVSPLVDVIKQLAEAVDQFREESARTAEHTANMLQDVRMMVQAPREAVRDPRTGRVTGSRVVLQ